MEDDIYKYTKSSLIQPDRSLPDNLLDDDEDEAYQLEQEQERLDMIAIINKKKSNENNFFSMEKDNISKKNIENKNIENKNIEKKIIEKKNIIKLSPNVKSEIRNFNPRLPLPNLKHFNSDIKHFNLNNNEFPIL